MFAADSGSPRRMLGGRLADGPRGPSGVGAVRVGLLRRRLRAREVGRGGSARRRLRVVAAPTAQNTIRPGEDQRDQCDEQPEGPPAPSSRRRGPGGRSGAGSPPRQAGAAGRRGGSGGGGARRGAGGRAGAAGAPTGTSRPVAAGVGRRPQVGARQQDRRGVAVPAGRELRQLVADLGHGRPVGRVGRQHLQQRLGQRAGPPRRPDLPAGHPVQHAERVVLHAERRLPSMQV